MKLKPDEVSGEKRKQGREELEDEQVGEGVTEAAKENRELDNVRCTWRPGVFRKLKQPHCGKFDQAERGFMRRLWDASGGATRGQICRRGPEEKKGEADDSTNSSGDDDDQYGEQGRKAKLNGRRGFSRERGKRRGEVQQYKWVRRILSGRGRRATGTTWCILQLQTSCGRATPYFAGRDLSTTLRI